MLSKTGFVAVLMLVAVARADAPSVPGFEPELVCHDERNAARLATALATPAPNDAAALARVERARRDLAAATKGRDVYRRSLDEAIAQLEAIRATWRGNVARRNLSARNLAECVERERGWYLARADAARAEEQRKAEEEAARRERLEKLMDSKPTMQLALSALICVANIERAAALRAIADEKKYARIGGVQNNAKIYELQQAIRELDQRIERFGRELKTKKAVALKCSAPKVKQVATCITAPVEDGPCLVDDVAGSLQVVRAIELGTGAI